MNMHVPQSIQTVEELKRIASVSTQLISPGNSSVVFPIVQDNVIGSWLLTKKDQKINRNQLNNLLMKNNILTEDVIEQMKTPSGQDEYGNDYWNGKDVFSMILPKITIEKNSGAGITVKKGQITDGFLSKKNLGQNSSGLIQQINNAFGAEAATNFLNNTQNLIMKFMEHESFSIGYGDCILDKENRDTNKEIIEKYIKKANDVLMEAYEGVYKPELDRIYVRESIEQEIQSILNECSEEIKKNTMANIDSDNMFYQIIDSGSKGKKDNLGQILGSVGPQDIWAKRAANGFTDRVLPHFTRYDIGPDAKGFCRSSFSEGIAPNEYYIHAIASRVGVIDTAIKTASSGYISRKFIKATEDISTQYDRTVRNSTDKIIQFNYGNDGLDCIKLEKSIIVLMGFNNDKMREYYQYGDINDDEYLSGFIEEDVVKDILKNKKEIQELVDKEFEYIMSCRDDLRHNHFKHIDVLGQASVYLPVNLYRLIPIIREDFGINDYDLSDLTPKYVIEEVKKLMDDIGNFAMEKELYMRDHFDVYMTFLASKRIIYEYRFNKAAFDFLIEKIKIKIYAAICNPGESVGVIASQTLGEASTQMTLNTFHLSGVGAGSKVVTQGIPRLDEIIRLSKNPKAVVTKIYLKEEYEQDEEAARMISSKLVYIKLVDIIERTEVLYENTEETSHNENMEFLSIYNEFSDMFDTGEAADVCLSNWVLRIIMDKDSLMKYNLTVADIQELIESKKGADELSCSFSDDNSNEVILRINILENVDNNFDYLKDLQASLADMTLSGIKGIKEADPVDLMTIKYNADGSHNEHNIKTIETSGSNLIEILGMDNIDSTRTISNQIIEVYEIFGIEAARNHIMNELNKVYNESSPNPKHIELIADVMTYRGVLMQIDRHGINRKNDCGPIAKAAFEETVNIFVKAAVFAEKDNMQGVSANILAGQFCKVGTNSFDVMLDIDAIENADTNNNGYEYADINKEDMDFDEVENYISNEFQDNIQVSQDAFGFGFGFEENNSFKLDFELNDDVKINIVDKNNENFSPMENEQLENIEIDEDEDNESNDDEDESNDDENESNDDENLINDSDVNEDETTDEEDDETTDEEDEETTDEEDDETTDEEDEETTDEEDDETTDEEDEETTE